MGAEHEMSNNSREKKVKKEAKQTTMTMTIEHSMKKRKKKKSQGNNDTMARREPRAAGRNHGTKQGGTQTVVASPWTHQVNLTGCLTAVTGLRTAKLLCESVSMCVSASMRVYESLELPSRQLCVWKSRETGNQLHVCMDCFLSLFFSLSLLYFSFCRNRLRSGQLAGCSSRFPLTFFCIKFVRGSFLTFFYCVAYTHTCVNVCIVGCCLPLTGFHLKLAKATCGNCVRL